MSTSFEQEQLDTPSSPPPTSAPTEASLSIGDMSPEYGTSLPSPTIEKQQSEGNFILLFFNNFLSLYFSD
jgi:hypothetical protein